MGYQFGSVSERNLQNVHPHLVRVARRAIQLSTVDFRVIEGRRTMARQRALVAQGASKTMNSRHLTGHAIDIAPWVGGTVRWDWPLFYPLAEAMKAAAAELRIPIRWGGNWKPLSETPSPIGPGSISRSFPDGPHFELPAAQYPADPP